MIDMLKKTVALLLIMTFLLAAAGCGNPDPVGAGKDNAAQMPPSDPGNGTEEQNQGGTSAENAGTYPPEAELSGEPAEPFLPETEPPPPERTLNDSDFALVKDYVPQIFVELRYAEEENFTGQVIYAFQDAYLRYGTVKKLIHVCNDLAEYGVCLKIWDAFRPPAAQFRLWEVCPDPVFVSDPNVKYSSHSLGNTVDVILTDEQGAELEMPSGFDDFSALADRNYSDCSPAAAANAMLLQEIMEKNGFSGYQNEWWHYSDVTEYPPEKCFDPAAISTWYADCSEYINLRSEPDSGAEVIIRIPAKAQFTLLGWTDAFALVDYQGFRGYAAADWIEPVGVTDAVR